MNYTKTTPCDNCPFRSDKPFPLTKGRVKVIQHGLVNGEFLCHKTTVEDDAEEGTLKATDKSQHCAGALILLEKLEQPSQMMRIYERFGLYDRRKLQMDAPVYDSWHEMQEGCKLPRRRKTQV